MPTPTFAPAVTASSQYGPDLERLKSRLVAGCSTWGRLVDAVESVEISQVQVELGQPEFEALQRGPVLTQLQGAHHRTGLFHAFQVQIEE
ncbi:hypothetical protein ACWDF9_18060 [Streptomyces rubiginosohelvolus]